MDEIRALHTEARRYCRARHDEYWEEYRKLVVRLAREEEGYYKTNQYTAEELAVYPRYLVLAAILMEVERLVPDACSTLDGLRERLRHIGHNATNNIVGSPANDPAVPVMQDERQQFIEHISGLTRRKLAGIKLLPFRRVLTDDEYRRHWNKISERWGKWRTRLFGSRRAFA